MFRKMRRFKQEITYEECCDILCVEKRGVLSVIGDDGYPYGVPMNFFYDPQEKKFYFHGAKEGHKIDAIKNNDKVCFTVWHEDYQNEDDGWSWHLRSVIAMGRARLITDPQENVDTVRKLGLKYFPTKDEVEAEIKKDAYRLQMIEVVVEHITGKRVHEK